MCDEDHTIFFRFRATAKAVVTDFLKGNKGSPARPLGGRASSSQARSLTRRPLPLARKAKPFCQLNLRYIRGSHLTGRVAGAIPPDDKRCIQRTKTGEQCKNWAQHESTVCRNPHGRAPQVQNAVARRQAAKTAKCRAIKKYEREGAVEVSGAEAVIALLEERMGVQLQMVRALDEIVGKLTAAAELRYEHRAGEQIRGELQVWIQLNQMVAKLGADYMKIGLDERKVRIAEAQARILIGVIQAVMGRLELTRDQKRLAAQVIPEELQRASIESGK